MTPAYRRWTKQGQPGCEAGLCSETPLQPRHEILCPNPSGSRSEEPPLTCMSPLGDLRGLAWAAQSQQSWSYSQPDWEASVAGRCSQRTPVLALWPVQMEEVFEVCISPERFNVQVLTIFLREIKRVQLFQIWAGSTMQHDCVFSIHPICKLRDVGSRVRHAHQKGLRPPIAQFSGLLSLATGEDG